MGDVASTDVCQRWAPLPQSTRIRLECRTGARILVGLVWTRAEDIVTFEIAGQDVFSADLDSGPQVRPGVGRVILPKHPCPDLDPVQSPPNPEEPAYGLFVPQSWLDPGGLM